MIARIKAATSAFERSENRHYGLYCHGPGEMADADYGYVGAGRGKSASIKRKNRIKKHSGRPGC